MKTVVFLAASLILNPAFANIGQGYCYEEASKYKELMHTQVLSDIEGDVNRGTETVVYSTNRYALDNLEEKFIFTVPTGDAVDGFTYLKYIVTTEAWIDTSNKAFICEVMSFSHEKTF